MKVEARRSVYAPMTMFDPSRHETDCVQVTEWSNGEGWDVAINERVFPLAFNELDAINYLVKVLEYDEAKGGDQ